MVKGINARRKGRRILSIDDEPDGTLTMKTVLENDGYTVDAFNDPVMALESFKKATEEEDATATTTNTNDDTANEKNHHYSLVLSDVKMPTMNGFELYQKIREIDKNIIVRFLTASEINYDEFKEIAAPTIDDAQNCFIRKPIENQKLLNIPSSINIKLRSALIIMTIYMPKKSKTPKMCTVKPSKK